MIHVKPCAVAPETHHRRFLTPQAQQDLLDCSQRHASCLESSALEADPATSAQRRVCSSQHVPGPPKGAAALPHSLPDLVGARVRGDGLERGGEACMSTDSVRKVQAWLWAMGDGTGSTSDAFAVVSPRVTAPAMARRQSPRGPCHFLSMPRERAQVTASDGIQPAEGEGARKARARLRRGQSLGVPLQTSLVTHSPSAAGEAERVLRQEGTPRLGPRGKAAGAGSGAGGGAKHRALKVCVGEARALQSSLWTRLQSTSPAIELNGKGPLTQSWSSEGEELEVEDFIASLMDNATWECHNAPQRQRQHVQSVG